MVLHSSRPVWGRFSVSKKMACIPAVFILALAVLTIYTIVTIQGQKSDAVVTDILGRQRVLIQRHMKEVLLVSQGVSDETEYHYTRRVLNETLQALLDGGPALETLDENTMVAVPPAPTPALQSKLLEQKQLLDQFVSKADQFLTLSRENPNRAAKLQELLELESKLYFVMNDAVKLFTSHSQGKSAALIKWETTICLAVSVLGIAFAVVIARGIVNPLADAVQLTQNVAQGDLRGEPLRPASRDEVGQLAETCNEMVGNLKHLTGEILSVTENVNSAATQISASTQQQASSTREQAATVQQITSTMLEINQSGVQIMERAKEVATTAEAATTVSRSGTEAVLATSRTMEGIREQVEEVAENIVALSEKTQAVGEIIATVNEIAEQSNLLALNATIEASAAGEQGNRFSVVAQEMKNLADQAKQCTVQVRSILGDIQKGINTSVMLTEEAVKRVESGKRQSEVTENAIRQMTQATEDSVQAFQQIISATNQQQIGFEQVTQGMQDIRQAAQQTAAGTSQLDEAVANLGALGGQLRTAVGGYRL